MRRLLLILSLLLIPIAFALEINPPTISLDVVANDTKIVDFAISNEQNFTFYNISIISMPNYLEFAKIPELQVNETINSTINITTITSGDYNPILTFRGYYFMNATPIQQNYYVNTTPLSFNPNSLSINQNDIINFGNSDNISHTVNCPTFFTQTILPNHVYSHQFTTVASITCIETIFNYNLNLNVMSSSQALTFSPSYDATLSLSIDSNLAETSISLEFEKNNYEIEWDGIEESFLKITNNGAESTDNLSVTADSSWISIGSYDAVITPGNKDIVLYNIAPYVDSTDDTNKNYSITFKIMGDNFDTKEYTIMVHVPYEDLGDYNANDTADWWESKLEFCHDFPDSPFCLAEPIIRYIHITNESDYNFTINVSSRLYYDLNRRLLEYGSSEQEFFQYFKENWVLERDRSIEFDKNLFKLLNESYQLHFKNQENIEDSRKTRNFLIVLFVFILVIGSLFGGIFYYKRKKIQYSGLLPT